MHMSAKGCATSLCVANRCADGVMSESQPTGPGRTGPNASANWPMSIIPTPPAFVWCSIISTLIQERPSMRRFRQRKPDGYWTVWSFTTPPKHASWLNMAEIAIGVLQSQCLDRRLDNADWLRSEIGAWEERRNQRQVKIHWSFTIAVARHKLHKLYPVIDNRKPPR